MTSTSVVIGRISVPIVAFNPFTVRDFPVYAGFFVFIEGGQRLADEDLLTLFGYDDGMTLVNRSELAELDRRQSQDYMGGVRRFVVMAETDRWKLIADDFLCTLWHRDSTRPTLCKLAAEHDILSFGDGDSDNSYYLRRFKGGRIVREWIADSQRLLVDFGAPLAGECGLQRSGVREYLQTVARANGFDVADAVGSARLWRGEVFDPNESQADVVAGETRRRTSSWRAGNGAS